MSPLGHGREFGRRRTNFCFWMWNGAVRAHLPERASSAICGTLFSWLANCRCDAKAVVPGRTGYEPMTHGGLCPERPNCQEGRHGFRLLVAVEPASIGSTAYRTMRWRASMPTVRVERRLAAIMATDIVAYSRLIETDEAGTLTAIRALRSEVSRPADRRPQGPRRQADG